MADDDILSDDILDDPRFQEWARRVQDELVPKLLDSSLTVSLVPRGPADVKFAVELGLSIMMDKPIIAVVQPGTQVPSKLIQVADRIVEGDPSTPEGGAKLVETINAIASELLGE